jgi:hypothetical protein
LIGNEAFCKLRDDEALVIFVGCRGRGVLLDFDHSSKVKHAI